MVGIKNFLGSIIGMMVGLEKFCVKITLLVGVWVVMVVAGDIRNWTVSSSSSLYCQCDIGESETGDIMLILYNYTQHVGLGRHVTSDDTRIMYIHNTPTNF